MALPDGPQCWRSIGANGDCLDAALAETATTLGDGRFDRQHSASAAPQAARHRVQQRLGVRMGGAASTFSGAPLSTI